MALSIEELAETSTTTASSASNGTSIERTHMPEEHHLGNEAQQTILGTQHSILCVACDDELSPENTWQAPC
jgi:hypothetical protein